MGVTTAGWKKGDVCGDGTVLYFDGGSGYMNPHL